MAHENHNSGLVAIIGGTGRVGRSVVESLAKNKIPVRVLTRSQEKCGQLPQGVEGMLGDPHEPETLKRLITDVENVFFVSLHDEQEEEIGKNIIFEAQRAGVKKIIFASAAYPNPKNYLARKAMWTLIGLMSPNYKPKLKLDEKVRKIPSGIVLMPSNFFQNDEAYRYDIMENGLYPQPVGAKGTSRIDTRDIGDAVLRVVLDDKHIGKVYPVAGPTLNGDECAAVWSEVLDKPILYAGDDLDAWEHRVKSRFDEKERQDFRKSYKLMQKVGFGVHPEVQKESEILLQKPLRSYRDYVKELIEKWNAT